MSFSPLLDELIESLRCLPGVGPRTAQRMAFHLLDGRREPGLHLAEKLEQAMKGVGHCERCRTFCESELCRICTDARRDDRLLLVLETPADILAIEQSGAYRGRYFVLMGHLSPIDGIGPEDIGLELLFERLAAGDIEELVLATGTTVEGEATAHFISARARELHVRTSRIAHGVPLGGELEYVDGGTLAHAISGRRQLWSGEGS